MLNLRSTGTVTGRRHSPIEFRHYVLATVMVATLVMVAMVVFALVLAAAALALICMGAAWVAWRMLPFRRTLEARSQSPVERLTDHFVNGNIDIAEFERRVARVIRKSAGFS